MITTFKLDGLVTQQDIDNRYFIMGQCKACDEWTKINTLIKKPFQCTYCSHNKYDMRGARSIRTWETTKHMKTAKNKRKR